MSENDWIEDFADDAEAPVAQPKESVESTGRQRGPDGKFIRAEAEAKAEEVEKGAQDAVEPQVTEPPSDDDDTGQVPLSVVKALRKELQELKKAQSAATQTQQPQAPQFQGPSVDFEDDPRSYLQQTLHAQKMQISQFMAAKESDEQTVQAAWQAFDERCKADPAVSAYSYTLLNHPHPMGELVKWYRREQEISTISEAGGLEALKQRWLAEQGIAPPVQQGKPNVPPSLAGTGKPRSNQMANDEGDGFDALFKR
jgi:hypothetical protein